MSLRGGLTPNQSELAVSLGFGSLACQVCAGFWRYNAGPANIPFRAPRDPASLYADCVVVKPLSDATLCLTHA